jgi:hypothetical protein
LLKAMGAVTVVGAAPLAAVGASGTLDVAHRPTTAFRKKMHAATLDRRVRVPQHAANGDEVRFPSGIANYTKGFPHDQFGEVDPGVYASYREAVRTGRQAEFDNLQMGGDLPLVDPQAGLAFDLEGIDVSQHAIPPFDTLASPDLAAQAVEVYWQALVRDVPFARYGAEPTTQAAAAELTSLAAFRGPRANGSVAAHTLFRGFTAGDQLGPYVSQFFVQPFTYGVIPFSGCMTTLPGDFMTDTVSWLKVQNGQRPFQSERRDPQTRYLRNARDLAEYVHNDVLFQEYLNAALMLATMHAPLNSRNPYDNLKSETGFITFGLPTVHVLVAEVIARLDEPCEGLLERDEACDGLRARPAGGGLTPRGLFHTHAHDGGERLQDRVEGRSHCYHEQFGRWPR